MREVAVIAKHCSGGIILGFEQFRAVGGVWKRGVDTLERVVTDTIVFPTPWNHLEAGILFGMKLPLLIFREPGISGGVFDIGVTDVFVHPMPKPDSTPKSLDALREVFLKWHGKVADLYYRL